MESIVADLLADRAPERARDLLIAWEERRNASWANADRDARAKAGTDGHLPQMRGQLRYHFGEKALVEAAQEARLGVIPYHTSPPGGVFTLARAGRFAIVSLSIPFSRKLPRRSKSRLLLGQANESIDPQTRLWDDLKKPHATQLAFLGCLVAVPAYRDPMAPRELAFGVPTAEFDDWISWTPLHRMHGLLLERVGNTSASRATAEKIEDTAFPTFKIPKEGSDEQSS